MGVFDVRMLLPSSYQVVAKLLLSIPSIRELLDKMVIPKSAKEMREFCGQKETGLDSEMGAGPYFFAKTQIKFGFLIDLHYLCRILKIML